MMPMTIRRLALGIAADAGRRRWPLAVPLRAEIIEQVLVKVNGEIFTKTDLEQRQVAAAAPGRTAPSSPKPTEERRGSSARRSPR